MAILVHFRWPIRGPTRMAHNFSSPQPSMCYIECYEKKISMNGHIQAIFVHSNHITLDGGPCWIPTNRFMIKFLIEKNSFFSHINRTDWLDGKHVVFGHVISGADVVRKMEKCGSKAGTTSQKVTIYACGELK